MVRLCLDIGNSNSKLGLFEDDKLIHFQRSRRIYIKQLKEIQERFRFKHVILSATGEVPETVQRYLNKKYNLLVLDDHTPLPIKILYKTPETLGRDRIAGIVGAYDIFPDQNNLVVDIGTCITYDFIDSKNRYLGGNIAPGVELRLKAMHRYTAKLPLVEREKNEEILGFSTESAMQNGAVWGTKCEIEAFIKMLKVRYTGINVILTGGDASYFAEMIKTQIFVHPNLVLRGLNKILAFNAV